MSDETFSFIVRCWPDPQTGVTHLKVVRVETGQEVHLNEGSFLVRISSSKAASASLERCFIRHIASGREAYVQSGSGLRAFIKACLLSSEEPGSLDPDVKAE